MADAAYPLLRRRRRRRLALPRVRIGGRAQLIALAVLGIVLVTGIVLFLRPEPRIDPRAAYDAGRKAMAGGNYSAARNDAIDAIAGQPRSAAAHLLLADAYLALGDGVAAEGEVIRLQGIGVPATRLHGRRARAQFLQGDLPAAVAEAAQAPADDTLAVRTQARALTAQGHADEAEQLMAVLRAQTPDDPAMLADLGRMRLSAGDIGGASDAAARAARLAPNDPIAATLQGEVVRARYGPIASLPWFEAALKRDAYYHPALIEYAATLGEVGRYADMLAATRKAAAARPGSPQALYLQATLAARAGNTVLARSLLAKAPIVAASMPGALLLGGGIDYAEGQYQQAIKSWTQLVAIQPLNVVARRLLGAALLSGGDAQGALDTLRPMALRTDADTYTLTLTARAFERLGNRADAARYLDAANKVQSAAAAPFATDIGSATIAADAAANPADPNYVIGLVRALLGEGNAAGAIARARSLASASPGAPAAQLALGDTLATANRMGEAVAAYTRAADLRFDEPTMLRLVDALARTGRQQDAAASLSLYLQQNPQSLVGQRLRAHWLVQAGQGERAIETLEGVRRMIGYRDALLLADLALAYAAAGDGGIARRYGQAAYTLLPMNAAVADAYGLALAADQDVDGARQLLAKAVTLDPANATIARHFAEVSR